MSRKKPSEFLLKKDQKLYMVPKDLVESLSLEEAFRVGLVAHIELRKQLLEDALFGDHYIEKLKIVDGLEASLKKLEDLFPAIRKQIRECDRGYHMKVARS